MKFVLLVYQGSTPLPGSDRWQALAKAEQKAIYAEYGELNKTEGVAPGLPLGLPDAARTVQVRDGKIQVKQGTYLAEGVGGFSVYEAENMEARSRWRHESPWPAWGARWKSGRPRSTGSYAIDLARTLSKRQR
jgi:hypothetical protein